MKKLGVLLIAVPVCLLSLFAVQRFKPQPRADLSLPQVTYTPHPGPIPRFVTYHLGGHHLRRTHWSSKWEILGKYDPKTGYAISSGDGPDGCEYIMSLEPVEESNSYNHEEKTWTGYTKQELKQIFRDTKVPLITGRGVRIGDSPQQVERKIGKPTKQKPWKDFLHYDYEYHGKSLYQANYIFQKNKLRSISFRSARAPGPSNPFGGCP